MVRKIQPDEHSSSTRSTSVSINNDFELCTNHFVYNSTPSQQPQIEKFPPKLSSPADSSADAKLAAQHREIERLVESRQRLHALKDQITTLHQSMDTPPAQHQTYEDKLNDSRNLRPLYQPPYQESVNDDAAESKSDHSNSQSDDDQRVRTNQSHMKQSVSDDVEHRALCIIHSFRIYGHRKGLFPGPKHIPMILVSKCVRSATVCRHLSKNKNRSIVTLNSVCLRRRTRLSHPPPIHSSTSCSNKCSHKV
jgi:hypothetical protein